MARTIIAIIAGYITMLVLVSLMITGAFLLMGTDWAFKPGSFETSNGWIVMSLVGNLIIAIVGGFICALIAKGGKAPLVLAIVVFVLGLLFAIPSLMVSHAGAVRTSSNIPMFEAMQKAEDPRWVPFTFPIVGVAGVLIGGKLKKRT